MPLELIVPRELLNHFDNIDALPEASAPEGNQVLMLAAAKTAGVLARDGDIHLINGEVRRLEQLLWMGLLLKSCGFSFHQEFIFNDETHRVIALNRLKARYSEAFEQPLAVDRLTPWDFLFYASAVIALCADQVGEYVFLRPDDTRATEALCMRLRRDFGVAFTSLPSPDGGVWMRTTTIADADSLLSLLRRQLGTIPCANEQFYDMPHTCPRAVVAKEMVFDSAHFITDHPGSCSNMHGGRYKLIVKLEDRVDPHTGFVVDYGMLKQLMASCVVDRLDHKNLNLSARDLAWRSSTELLNVFIWESLIDYLPNLFELQIYETEQSYCSYRGPTLEEYQREGIYSTGSHFVSPNLGRSLLRRRLGVSQLSLEMHVIDSDSDSDPKDEGATKPQNNKPK